MKYGLFIFPTEQTIQPADLARAAEEHEFESIWFPEHTHIPASRRSPWPGGSELPKEYYETYDPFVALAVAAGATARVKLGTAITLVVERDPITLAKEVASIDRLSGGRFLFGVGGGWNAEEMENHGTAFKTRWKLMRERIEAMKAIWTEEAAEYHGEFVNFDPIYAWPKPLQKPHPPIYVGGVAPYGIRRAVRYGDGWIPIGVQGPVEEQVPLLRKAASEAGRDPDALEVIVHGARPDRDLLARYRDAGVSRAIFGLPPRGPEDALPRIERYAELAREVG